MQLVRVKVMTDQKHYPNTAGFSPDDHEETDGIDERKDIYKNRVRLHNSNRQLAHTHQWLQKDRKDTNQLNSFHDLTK